MPMRSPATRAALAVFLLLGAGAPAWSQEKGIFPFPASAVGIRVSVTAVRPVPREADLDLTMYTRLSAVPSTYAGTPYFGIPALDYGDGSTLPTTTLVLASPGGGPGGSNVYRSVASFTHTYPAPGSYTVRTGMFCFLCYRVSYAYFPAGSTPPTTFSYVYDFLPTTVIGNLAVPYLYSGTYPTGGGTSSVRYRIAAYAAITNSAVVQLSPGVLEIPTAQPWGLLALGGALLGSGVLLLRRS